jgi:maltose/moltooligosaccharide transporter
MNRAAARRRRPAQALLDAVGSNPANLIVVGNRGLGASEGQRLGSVPSSVVTNATFAVLVGQTSALDEYHVLGAQPAEAATDGAGPVTGAGPGR